MKNSKTIVAILLVMLVVGIIIYIWSQKKSLTDTTINLQDLKKPTEEIVMEESEMATKQDGIGGSYVVHSGQSLEESINSRRVLFFYASWCPTCKPADADLIANESKIPNDVTVIRVNYDDSDTDTEESELAKKYGITYQHTFVQIDSQGKEIAKWNGGKIDELLEKIK